MANGLSETTIREMVYGTTTDMTKITIERETLELAIAALTYHQTQTRPIESTRITLETLRALLAAQPPTVDGHLKCGHHQSLAINSAETGEFLYCDLCDAKSRCRDAEAMEAELRAALAAQPAQPADAQPTGQSPCARHCEAPAFEGEIRRLKREATIKDSLTIRPPAPAAVPLTDEQIDDICWNFNCSNTPLVEYDRLIARAIEAAHGIAAAGDKP